MKTSRALIFATTATAVGLFLATSASAQSPPKRSFEELVAMPLVLKIPGMDAVKVTSNLKYHPQAPDPNLLMDVYVASNAREARPAVIFLHGGAGSGSRAKDWGFYKSWGRLAAASGFVGVTINHSLGYPVPLLDKSEADANAAIDYVRANAPKLGVDPDRICLAAFSAGGPVLIVGLEQRRVGHIKCLMGFYTFLDIQQSSLHRDNESAGNLKKFALVERLSEPRAQQIPMFIARAGLDEIPTMNESIDRFLKRAIDVNANVVYLNHPKGFHTFDSQNDDDRSREILRAALAFLHEHLDRK
jgi:acetyl esterase/lipase